MKTKPFTQNQLVAHPENGEKFSADENPSPASNDDTGSTSLPEGDNAGSNYSSPFDLFENVKVGSNSIEDGNWGSENINLSHPEAGPVS